MKNRKTLIGFVVIALLASFGVAAFALQTSAADLMTQSLERLEAAESGHAIVTFEIETPDESGTGTVELWGELDAGPNGEPAVRVEILDSSFGEMVGATAVTDGTNFWVYDPEANEVVYGTFEEMAELAAEKEANGEFEHDGFEGDFDPENFDGELPDIPENAEEAVNLMLEYFTAERAGRATIGNSNANVIRLVPIPEQMPDEIRAAGGLVNVWIRRGDTAPLGAEFVGSVVGSARMEVTTLDLDLNIDPEVFTFETPEGATEVHFSEVEREAWSAEGDAAPIDFELLNATAVPDGAILRETTTVRGAVVQRYGLADGASFSIAQGRGETAVPQDADAETVTVRGLEAVIYTDDSGTRTLLSWSEDGLNVWIGGDLTPEQAVEIAESLE
ncbi:MAG: hypothetical protein AAF490_19795 [Chloroflexota bacterium]